MAIIRESTLLDLIQSIISEAANDEEVVATIVYLINSGRVRLCGSFAGAKISFPRKILLQTDAPLNSPFS